MIHWQLFLKQAENLKNIIWLSSTLAFLASCAGEGGNHESPETTEDTVAQATKESPTEASFHLDLIIANNIAAPVKLLTDMNEAGLTNYDETVTNPVENLDKYATSEQKALNFGIYGADLSYQSLYGNHEKMADYLITIRSLADELGLISLFTQEAYEEFERIKTNPDSVKMYIFAKYDEADEYLRSNDRVTTACLVLTGGLIESLHLVSSQIAAGEANAEAYRIFLGQKNTLANLVSLFEELEKEGHSLDLKADIQALHAKFVELDSFDKFSKNNVNQLHEAIDAVRDKLV